MAVQIYSEEFYAHRYTSRLVQETDEDVRLKILYDINDFFFKRDGCDIINIIEHWDENKYCLKVVVYYKSYI